MVGGNQCKCNKKVESEKYDMTAQSILHTPGCISGILCSVMVALLVEMKGSGIVYFSGLAFLQREKENESINFARMRAATDEEGSKRGQIGAKDVR